MSGKLYWCWGLAQSATAFFLLRGMEGAAAMAGFAMAHTLAMGVSWLITVSLLGTDSLLKSRVRTRAFSWFSVSVAAVPLIGPAVCLFVAFFLRFGTLFPVRVESFQKVNPDVLMMIQKRMASRSVPVTEALLVRGLSRDEAMRMVGAIGEMPWAAAKASILRYIIRFCPYQNVILMAVDLLRQKMDTILDDIAGLEQDSPDADACHRIASLYHEIDYLNLAEPMMKAFYQQKACEFAVRAYRLRPAEDGALVAVRYLLEADRVVEAKAIYEQVRRQGSYFFPKWITYEFEFSMRLDDRNVFNDLFLLIESGGGVFIPDKVQQAAKAWRKLLTSAWL